MASALRVFHSPGGNRQVLAEIKGVVPASRLGARPQPRTILTGIPQVDELTGGVPRGALTEIFGPASSGRTSLLLALVAQMTAREEVCALVDASDVFDPHSARAAGVDLERMLWVRCGKNVSRSSCLVSRKNQTVEKRETRNEKLSFVEQALCAADLLLQAGGFGLLAMDLGDIPPAIARRIPLTSWFRFRRAVENTATALVVVEQEASAKSCASLVLKTRHSALSSQQSAKAAGTKPTHARLLSGLQLEIEVLNSRIPQRKPVRSATTSFESRASWFG
jgi:ABC-type cobalamin/Fe3+-siderophores transport system ATPase subunit